jgi:flagellar L-ring protein precursor FlgH
MRLLMIFCAAGVLAGVVSSLGAQPISLFADPKATGAGDALTVIIQERASASNRTATSTEKNNKTEITSAIPGADNLLSFIPLHALDSELDNAYKGTGTTSRSANLTARITVTVAGKKANGDLLIEGVRRLKINGETEAIYLSGAVSPASIRPDNTVLSTSIADLQVEYTGKGTITQGSRPGVIVRFINWIF